MHVSISLSTITFDWAENRIACELLKRMYKRTACPKCTAAVFFLTPPANCDLVVVFIGHGIDVVLERAFFYVCEFDRCVCVEL